MIDGSLTIRLDRSTLSCFEYRGNWVSCHETPNEFLKGAIQAEDAHSF